MTLNLSMPTSPFETKPRITVIGVGGAGGNAINNMIASGLQGVDFVVANTDAQALTQSSAEHRIQLGMNLTEGLGAGSRPEIGQAAAEEALDEIRAQISGSHMVFIAAGMGGGTGSGAAGVSWPGVVRLLPLRALLANSVSMTMRFRSSSVVSSLASSCVAAKRSVSSFLLSAHAFDLDLGSAGAVEVPHVKQPSAVAAPTVPGQLRSHPPIAPPPRRV